MKTSETDLMSRHVPLLRWTHYWESQLVKLLLEYGADPNARDEFGDTPTEYAFGFRRRPTTFRNGSKVSAEEAANNARKLKLLLDAGGTL